MGAVLDRRYTTAAREAEVTVDGIPSAEPVDRCPDGDGRPRAVGLVFHLGVRSVQLLLSEPNVKGGAVEKADTLVPLRYGTIERQLNREFV